MLLLSGRANALGGAIGVTVHIFRFVRSLRISILALIFVVSSIFCDRAALAVIVIHVQRLRHRVWRRARLDARRRHHPDVCAPSTALSDSVL